MADHRKQGRIRLDFWLFRLGDGAAPLLPLLLATLGYAFSKLSVLHDRVAALPELQDYLSSDRRLPFNEDGIFRHYPELDAP